MKTTYLLIGHGSRDPDGNPEIEDFAEAYRRREGNEGKRVDVCYIEYADVLMPEGLAKAAEGSDRVIAVPLILNAAGHVKMEIPAAVAEARKAHPEVEFITARHLGTEEILLKKLRMRLHSAMAEMDMPDPKTTGVILLARGSSDMGANGEVARMARWLYETTRHDLVDYAFTGVTYPRLEESVQGLVAQGATQLMVVPYYLFTGRLIKRIGDQVARLRTQYPTVPFGLARYIGVTEHLMKVVDQRIEEAETGKSSMLECDGCKYREIAEEHSDHHHHH